MTKNITVILGHPDSSSYCGALAATYVQAAEAAGHSVKFFKLGEVAFDATLHHGHNKRQELELWPKRNPRRNYLGEISGFYLPQLVGFYAFFAQRTI